MTQNYQISSLLPKGIDCDSPGTTDLNISPVLKSFYPKILDLHPRI